VHFLHTFKRFVFSHPGLAILVVILTVMTVGMIKPDFYLMGWDNFSSYLNPKTNLFNTLFATWREHRGLGVPSDSEIMDLPRQIFNLILIPIVGMKMSDQIYFASTLWGGVLGMYVLARYIAARCQLGEHTYELIGFFSAFFYLFNLNTLAVYYFPMVMYNTRFFMLPTTIYVLLRFIYDPPHTRRMIALYILILLFGMGTYMVATLFITFSIVLGLFLLFSDRKKRAAQVLLLYVLFNSIWLLTFGNYTIQKSAVVPSAPTFIIINDAELNKSPDYFSFENQAKLRPSFFDSKFKNRATGADLPFHPLASTYQQGIESIVLWIWPVLYLGGCIYIFMLRRHRILMWLASIAFTFLFLSMKDYSPLGVVYGFILDHVPFASTIFRFGDTKFHAMIAFSGSIIAAIFLAKIIEAVRRLFIPSVARLVPVAVVVVLITTNILTFQSYFRGQVIGFFMYNQIPQAYFDIAKKINDDPENLRVIQLPFDKFTYWKPYSWGYFGSSFLHFMLNKPIIDRTFEPASVENADVHQRIMEILNLASTVPFEKDLNVRASRLTKTLRDLSVKYVIDDQSISPDIESRGIMYWGTINPTDSGRLLAYMAKMRQLKLVAEYEVSLETPSKNFEQLYPYLPTKNRSNTSPKKIKLYEVIDTNPRLELLHEVDVVHSNQPITSSVLATNLITRSYIQDRILDDGSLIFPFIHNSSKLSDTESSTILTLPLGMLKGKYVFELGESVDTSHIRHISIQKNKSGYYIFSKPKTYPAIAQAEYADVDQIATFTTGDIKAKYDYISVAGLFYDLGKIADASEHDIGDVMVTGANTPITFYTKQQVHDVSSALQQLESNPQCLGDSLGLPKSAITGDLGVLRISGQNVSNCFTTPINLDQDATLDDIRFATMTFSTRSQSNSALYEKDVNTGKEKLRKYILEQPSPTQLEICIKSSVSDFCLNEEKNFTLSEAIQSHTVTLKGDLGSIKDLKATFIVRSTQLQKYDVEIADIVFSTFLSGPDLVATQPIDQGKKTYFAISRDISSITLALPYAYSDLGTSMQMTKSNYWHVQDADCLKSNKDAAIRTNINKLLTYAVGCRTFIVGNTNFNSNAFYIWSVDYTQLSGALPTFNIMDDQNTYLSVKLQPSTVNPDQYTKIPLQRPEHLLGNQDFESLISHSSSQNSSGYLYPASDLKDNKKKRIVFDNYSNNESIQLLSKIQLTQLPTDWATSKIYSDTYQPLKYDSKVDLSVKRLLPSLWIINTMAAVDQSVLLKFNEQFDNQWRTIGLDTNKHLRCDGASNCYDAKIKKGNNRFVIIYIPEVLNIIGILASSVIAIYLLKIYKRASR